MKLRTILSVLTVVSILQLGLLWLQGAQLYRQQESLQALRLDIQELAEIIDAANPQGGEEGRWSPSGHRGHRGHFRRIALQEEEGAGVKETQQSQEAVRKSLKEASEAQHKLSISEAAKRAEEKQKVEAAKNEWVRMVWIALGILAFALILRAWLRRR